MKTAILNINIDGISDESYVKVESRLCSEWRVAVDDCIGFDDGSLRVDHHYAEVTGKATKQQIAEEIHNLIKEESENDEPRVTIGISFVEEEVFTFGEY
jgi:hypothetical protein